MEILSALSYFSVFLALLYFLVVCTFIRGWQKIQIFEQKSARPTTPVTVLIAARNEEDQIGQTLNDLLAQTYNKALLEIIVIDDHSTDATAEVVSSFESKGVKLIRLNESNALNSYKKKAIEKGIQQASGKLIITTDADCRMGISWLATVVSFYETYGCKMISSPVAYFDGKRYFERMQTLEFSYLIGLGASTIGNNSPSTCNGANLAYEREAFFDVGGFKGIDDLASGDDELLLHKMAARYKGKIGFLKNRDAIVYTHAKQTLYEFIQQRKRWASKSTKYKDKVVIMLGLSIWLFNLSIIVNTILAFIYPQSNLFNILLFQLGSKIMVEFIFLNSITSFFKTKQLLVLLPVLNLLHVLYLVYIGIVGNMGKYQWKNRTVR